jgi:hypothetical protein
MSLKIEFKSYFRVLLSEHRCDYGLHFKYLVLSTIKKAFNLYKVTRSTTIGINRSNCDFWEDQKRSIRFQ